MRIGINLLYMIPGVVGGTETYAMGLISGLKRLKSEHEFVLFLNRESSGLILNDAQNFRCVVCPVNAASRRKRYFFEQVQLRQYVEKYGIDLLHSLGYTSPPFLQCQNVVSVPDLNFRAFGHLMPLSRRLVLATFVRQSVARSDKVITISEFSRQEILKAYRVPPEKVVVTHLGVDAENLARDLKSGTVDNSMFSVDPPYCVAFSSSYPNKNIARLIEAFQESKKGCKLEHKLVLIGHQAEVEEKGGNKQIVREREDIIWTGYVERQRVFDILKRADFLIFPSFYEGFGLPVLEAMAVGVPVVCSKAASLPEVAGDAAVFFDPFSVMDMSEQIVSVATNPHLREKLREKGFENLKRFSWRKTAAETIAVYEDILSKKKTTSSAELGQS